MKVVVLDGFREFCMQDRWFPLLFFYDLWEKKKKKTPQLQDYTSATREFHVREKNSSIFYAASYSIFGVTHFLCEKWRKNKNEFPLIETILIFYVWVGL